MNIISRRQGWNLITLPPLTLVMKLNSQFSLRCDISSGLHPKLECVHFFVLTETWLKASVSNEDTTVGVFTCDRNEKGGTVLIYANLSSSVPEKFE